LQPERSALRTCKSFLRSPTRDGKPVYSSPLYKQLVRKREECRDDEDRCIEEGDGAGGPCGSHFIEFVTADDRVHGFAYSQLMNYTLENISESEHKADASPGSRPTVFLHP
jgi:hypothetical protein